MNLSRLMDARACFACLSALSLPFGVMGCADDAANNLDAGSAADSASMPRYTATHHGNIVSENGPVTLEAGTLEGVTLSLLDDEGERLVWIREQTFDFGALEGHVQAQAAVPAGTYVSFFVHVAPTAPGRDAFDARIHSEMHGEVRVRYDDTFERERRFDAPLVVSDGDSLAIDLNFLTLFFYTWPYDRAVDGVWHAHGILGAQETLEVNFANAFSLRVAD